MGKDPDFAEYINNTLGIRIMPQMAREKSNDQQVSKSFYCILHNNSANAPR